MVLRACPRLLAGLVLACGLARPAAACDHLRDLLLGDSIADRMRAAAVQDGFQVVARDGAQLSWATRQEVGCVARLVLVIGTNDLRDIRSAEQAQAYVDRVRDALARWQPRRAVWLTPSCFDAWRNPVLHRGGMLLQAALHRFPVSEAGALADGHRDAERRLACPSLATGDGVHPEPATAARWWRRALAGIPGAPARSDR